MNPPAQSQPENPASRPPSRFPAFQSRPFRELWTAQTISIVGSQMQMAALRWHIYMLTRDPVSLAMLSLVRFIPIVLFSLLGGAVADARDRRRIILATQGSLVFGALVLFWITKAGMVTAWAIYALNALNAAAIAFDNPARQSLTPNLVPREHYANAVSLNSLSMRAAMIVGPLIAGVLIGIGQLGLVYAVNAVSYVGVLIAISRMRGIQLQPSEEDRPDVSWKALKEGLIFVWRTPILVWSIALDFLATFFSSAEALLPVIATEVLHTGPAGYGILTASEAVGSLAAGAAVAYRGSIQRHGRVILISVLVYGLATVLFGASPWLWLSCVSLAAVGAADTVSTILRQSIRQLVTPDQLRGRMSATTMVFFMGGPQLGNVEAGLVAKSIGAQWSVITGGIGCLIAVGWVAAKGRDLRDYRLPKTAV